MLLAEPLPDTHGLAEPIDADQYAKVKWEPYTDPKTGRRGRISEGGQVRYDEPPKKAESKPKATAPTAPTAPALAEPIPVSHLEGSEKGVSRAFHGKLKASDLPGLVGAGGAPSGSEVNVTELRDGAWVTLKGDWGMATRTILNNGIIKNENIEIEKKGQGIGSSILAEQVRNAVEQGFKEIRAFASGGPGERDNGYYTWPRLGFDGELPESVLDRLPDRFMGEDIVMVSDLMKTKAGRDWWRYNGEPLSLTFDLSEGSQSRKVLDAYMKKAAKKPKPPAAAARSAPKPKPPTIEQVQSMLGDDKARNRSIARSVLSLGSLEAAYEHFSDPEQFGADKLGRAMAEAIYLSPESDAAHLVSRIAAPKPYAKDTEEDDPGTLDLSPREEEALDSAWESVYPALAEPISDEPVQHARDGWTIVRYGKADLADWVEEKAPRAKSGRRWRNTKTGKRRYEPPKGWEKKNEEAKPADKPAAKPAAKPGELPEGWTSASRGGIATNKDPVHGGIVDREIASGDWFVIPAKDGIGTLTGFKTREEALAALEEAVKGGGKKEEPTGLADAIPEPPGPDASPREQAEFETKKQLESSEYIYARQSAVPNAGEDLLGSARHRKNEWRGLAVAEKEGNADQLVVRDRLFENEPLDLISKVGDDGRNSLSCLAGYLVMKTFPPTPEGKYGSRADAEEKAKNRELYLQSYLLVKNKIEELATEEPNPLKLIEAIHGVVKNRVETLRKEHGRYNAIANELISMLNRTQVRTWSGGFGTRFKQNHAAFGVMQFTEMLQKGSQGTVNKETLGRAGELVKDIMEGKSIAKAFGDEGGGGGSGERGKRLNLSEFYVKTAERKGGKPLDFKDANAATQYMVKNLGMRGVQWGNSVTDGERLHHAKFSAEAINDLTDILGLPTEIASLGGMIGLAIGARGRGGALAHYEPIDRDPDGKPRASSGIINLTRKGGVGSLAHEWGHAFDHVLAGALIISSGGRRDGDYYSEHISSKRFVRDATGQLARDEKGNYVAEDKSNDPLWKAYDQVRKTWQDSGFKKRLTMALVEAEHRGYIPRTKRSYWTSGREMFARCFERYIQRKLQQAGRLNTYLTGIDAKSWDKSDDFPHGGFWPNDEEVEAMAPAFDAIFEAYRKQQEGEKPMQHLSGDRPTMYQADPLEINDLDDDYDPFEIDDLDEEEDFADSQTPLMFSLDEEEPAQYEAQDWVAEPAPIKGGTRWKHKVTGEITYDDPTGKTSRPEEEKNDVGQQPPGKPADDSWVSLSMDTQRKKWRQKLESAQHDYQLIRKKVRDTGATHEEIEADKGVQKAVKRIEAIRAKLGSLEGGETELRAARDEMAEPMAAFAAGEITDEQLVQETKPHIDRIAKILGEKTTRKLFEKAKAAVNSDTFKQLQATWPARIASLIGIPDDWLRSSFIAVQAGLPATEVSLGAWLASFVIVRGLDALKRKFKKGPDMLEQKAREDGVPPEMVDLLHKWISEMAAVIGIEPMSREQIAAKLEDSEHAEHYAKAEADRFEKQDDTALLASLLGGYALDGWVFVPTERKDRFLRARVVRAASNKITGPENCENVIVSDDRPGRKHDIYFRFGSGDFELSEATPIDPSEGPDALLRLIREERPRSEDPNHPCPED